MRKITRDNYDQEMQRHGKTKYSDNWPFLSRNPDIPGTANETHWANYFANHLGGYPTSFQLFRKGTIRYYNLPEVRPEDFDTTYNP